jgi:hypothetical protein
MINGHFFQTNLVPIGESRYRLFINGEMRKQAGVDVGSEISIELELDPQPPIAGMPEVFKLALEQNPEAQSEYERLTPSRKKDILRYMNSLKHPETLQRIIERVIMDLTLKK